MLDDPHALATARTDASPRARDQTGISGRDASSRQQEVIDRLALKKGLAQYQVSLSYLAERARTHPWIKEATIERLPLHELRVTVVERTPAAIVPSRVRTGPHR